MRPILPDDPRDLYIFSDEPITLEAVSKRYREAYPVGKGFSASTLENRSSQEGWAGLREAYKAKLVESLQHKSLEKKAERIIQAIEALDEEAKLDTQKLLDATRDLIKQAIIINDDGTRTIKLRPSELKSISETIDLLHKKKRFHSGFEPNRVYGSLTLEVDGQEIDDDNPLITALSATALIDWGDSDDTDQQNKTGEAREEKEA